MVKGGWMEECMPSVSRTEHACLFKCCDVSYVLYCLSCAILYHDMMYCMCCLSVLYMLYCVWRVVGSTSTTTRPATRGGAPEPSNNKLLVCMFAYLNVSWV